MELCITAAYVKENSNATFMGRSKPDEEVCRHTPKSADPVKANKEL